jgi:glycosyltransferase involved in cell wall biosynthesis
MSSAHGIKVVHIITGLNVGGAEKMLAKILAPLAGRFDSHVISLTSQGPVATEISRAGAKIYSLNMTVAVPSVTRAFFRLVRLLRGIKPDVIQTWMYHSDLIGGAAARIAGIRAVAWNVRNGDLSSATKLTTRGVVRLCAALSHFIPTVIVCCSDAARSVHEQAGYNSAKFIVIPNGFDLQRFRPDQQARSDVRRELKVPLDAPIIGLIARFDPQKDHHLFCKAAGRLHRLRPDVHYLLAGAGVDAANRQLADWLSAAGIAKVTRLLGERSDVPRLTAALDIATCCSAWGESFPNTLGEAAACEVPCVTTDVGDAAAIVGELGWVVPRRDAVALACAWDSALGRSAQERHRLGGEARSRLCTNFEIGAVAARYAALYEALAREEFECLNRQI